MSHRINVMIDDQIWEALQQIPKGERRQVINESLAEWLIRQRRQCLLHEMQDAAQNAKAFGEDTVTLLRRQRYHWHPDQEKR